MPVAQEEEPDRVVVGGIEKEMAVVEEEGLVGIGDSNLEEVRQVWTGVGTTRSHLSWCLGEQKAAVVNLGLECHLLAL